MVPEPQKILLIGDPRLREVAEPVADIHNSAVIEKIGILQVILEEFRRRHSFGRAIAAPQIGVPLRIIALNLDAGPFVMINPEITWHSPELFTLWDDCMSFPFLLVRLRRYCSITVRYRDLQGETQELSQLDRTTAELLQHEIDHLDGILALDHAIDRNSIVARELYEQSPEQFNALADG